MPLKYEKAFGTLVYEAAIRDVVLRGLKSRGIMHYNDRQIGPHGEEFEVPLFAPDDQRIEKFVEEFNKVHSKA